MLSGTWRGAHVQMLCEGMNANVSICFDQPGQPLLVEPLFNSTPPNVLVRGLFWLRCWLRTHCACK
jgi:hypothetical protein